MALVKKTDPSIHDLFQYLQSESNEDARRPLLYPVFRSLFKEKFKIESDAKGADVYIEGQLLVESKTDFSQWLEGFYQGLHYQRRYGLAYHTVMVVANRFCGIWKLDNLPEHAVILSKTIDPLTAPNDAGKENARKTSKANKLAIKESAIYWLEPGDLDDKMFQEGKSLTHEAAQILKTLRNLNVDRLQINTHNFIDAIERMKPYFNSPIEAVHAFYTIVAHWDITSTVAENDNGELRVIGFSGKHFSEAVSASPRFKSDFRKFVESQYVFTNEGSGITVDYYFSRFDEVMARIDPEYVKQHGIFFTDANLSRFALWFAKQHFPGNINENYIVFDPAGGSGNLVSSWRGKLRHKIISELQPDLLKIIDRRMRVDPFHTETGFTIVPKTVENRGLNFLDRSAEDYLLELKRAVKQSFNLAIDKPIAFLLNPPYKNTDEREQVREAHEAAYDIHPDILDVTGSDAGKERYLAFLGQILLMAKAQVKENDALKPVVMIFTPTSWLIPRPTYKQFREQWDKHFRFHSGFIITGNEFFKISGRWPLAFTIWIYDRDEAGHNNAVNLYDLTELKRVTLDINWNADDEKLANDLSQLVENSKVVRLDASRGDIQQEIPATILVNGKLVKQTRQNIYRNRTRDEAEKKFVSGFPVKDPRHINVATPYGYADGTYIGFMDDCTPVWLRIDAQKKVSNEPDRIWFYLDNRIIKINLCKSFSGPADNRSFCAHDLISAKFFFQWYSIAKAIANNYPVWVNQYNLWAPRLNSKLADYWYSLCFAFVLAENRCVVTKFEADNPVAGAPEVFVDNPMSPINRESFWSTTLASQIVHQPDTAQKLVQAITDLYKLWSLKYCKGHHQPADCLRDEPYFKYFSYEPFITPHSGLIQIKEYARREEKLDLLEHFERISKLTKDVKAELYRLLVDEFNYFD